MIAGETGHEFSVDELSKFEDFNSLSEYLVSELKKAYDEKMTIVDADQKRAIEKQVYLQVVDKDWREHLYQMDILKTGIGLRGYNQKDPLTEYKKESYNLFVELVARLKRDSVRMLQAVRFKTKEEIEAEERARAIAQQRALEELNKAMEESARKERAKQENSRNLSGNLGASNSSDEAKQSLKREPIRVEKKPKRNEPCPCGSGKKYKECCGKSGPKKGAFASEEA